MTNPFTLHGGYYDVFRTAELKAELGSVEPHSDVILDLSTTEHLDCGSLGVMIGKLQQWRRRKPGTQLCLMHVAPRMARILTILNLDQVFKIV